MADDTMSYAIKSVVGGGVVSSSGPDVPPRRLRDGQVPGDGENPKSREGRRDSLLSNYSMDDARQSIRSSTDSLLHPRPAESTMDTHLETSNWHSVPLAFALLPAVAGMAFTNGSAVVTDVTLLALAGVFLNWSVRVPWDWYRSAQTFEPDNDDGLNAATEEGAEDDNSSTPVQDMHATDSLSLKSGARPQHPVERGLNSSELHMHELLALLSCFLFPLAGAVLLHGIRAQLSRPSEGLVSNYNLTIFLLAAEVRPTAHLFRMLQARTLYLQRTGTTNPYRQAQRKSLANLAKRLEALEVNPTPNGSTSSVSDAQTNKSTALVSTEVRRTIQPDLDALNRAVRRYEKRATVQTMQTESRLADLEARLNDALSLAAVAAQSGQQRHQSYGTVLFEWSCAAIVLPLQALFAFFKLPAKASGGIVALSRAIMAMGPHQSNNGSETRYRVSARGKERFQVRSAKRNT